MTQQQEPSPTTVNEVHLVGRVGRIDEPRELPSGSVVVGFGVVTDRAVEAGSRRAVDALDCAAWSPATRRSVAAWAVGDVVEVTGSLRRRFFRTPAGAASRYEIEVTRARRVRRGAP